MCFESPKLNWGFSTRAASNPNEKQRGNGYRCLQYAFHGILLPGRWPNAYLFDLHRKFIYLVYTLMVLI